MLSSIGTPVRVPVAPDQAIEQGRFIGQIGIAGCGLHRSLLEGGVGGDLAVGHGVGAAGHAAGGRGPPCSWPGRSGCWCCGAGWAAADGLPEPTACRVEVWRWNAGLSGADVREQVLVGLLAEVRRYGAAAA